MPYIKQERRPEISPHAFGVPSAESSGELNYQLTEIVLDYMHGKGKSYSTINDIVGALEGCKMEFYRRVAVPYEDQKKFDNGDVYD